MSETKKIDNGLQKIEFDLKRYESVKNQPKRHDFQVFALEVCEKLQTSDKGLIFKICKKYPRAYVERCLNATLKYAQGTNKARYFVKVIYSTS